MADGDRDPIWSIRPRMRTAYLLTFAALFGSGIGLLVARGSSLETIMGLAGSVAIGSAGAAMFVAETGGYVMVFVDAAIAWRDKKFTERVRNAVSRARARTDDETDAMVTRAMAEALAETEAKTHAEMEAWYARHGTAKVPTEPVIDDATDAVTRAVAEALAETRAEVERDWLAWYARMEDAKARGVPFDEPPPGVNGRADPA